MNASHSPVLTAADALREAVGAQQVRAATPADAIDGVQPQCVVEPDTEEQVARVLKTADAAGLVIAGRGGGTKLAWGNPPKRVDVVLSLSRLNRVLEHAASDLTATAQAGCTLAALERVLSKERQRLALDALWPERATVGGILATNDSGALRVRFGGLRDLIIGVTLALPDGTLAKSGGKVVKNVAGYDLPKLATGSLGTLAVITQATFRLHPLNAVTRALTVAAKDAAAANQFVLAVLDSKLAPFGLQIRGGAAQPPVVDIRFEGTQAGVDAQCTEVSRLAGGSAVTEAAADVWLARQALSQPADSAVVAKFSVLPANLAAFCHSVVAAAQAHACTWDLVTQGTGLGALRLEARSLDAFRSAVADLRAAVEPEGSLVVLQCPLELKSKFDVWGPPGDALDLMRRVKREFDPRGTLNPGRFIGGI